MTALEEAQAYLDQRNAPTTDVSTLSDEELIQQLSDEQLLQLIQERKVPQPVAQAPLNRFDSPQARALFRSGGQFIGGLSAGALATPETFGVGTLPTAALGGVGGGIAGESVRQFLASLTGGGPRSTGEQIRQLGTTTMEAMGAESLPPAIRGVARPIGFAATGVARAIYRNIPDPVLSWVKTRASQGIDILKYSTEQAQENIFSSIKRMGQALQSIRIDPTKLQPPSPKTLYPVAEKAANAFEAVREQVVASYGKAADLAQAEPVRLSMVRAQKVLRTELKQKGLLLEGSSEALPLTADERLLRNVWEDFRRVSQAPTEGLPEAQVPGTFMNYQTARRFLDRMDEAMGSAKGRNTVRILSEVRARLVDGLKAADAGLAKQIPAYGKFVGLRDTFETILQNPDRTVSTLLSSLKETKGGLRGQLKELDDLAPKDLKFFQDLLQFERLTQAAEKAKNAPKTVNALANQLRTPQQMEKLIRNIFAQPETTLAELEALETVSGMKFLDEFKDMAARTVFSSFRPAGFGYPTNLAFGALGFGGGGPVGAGLGLMAGTAMSTPRIQAEMLRRVFPPALWAQLAGRQVGRLRPIAPAAISSLLPRETTESAR